MDKLRKFSKIFGLFILFLLFMGCHKSEDKRSPQTDTIEKRDTTQESKDASSQVLSHEQSKDNLQAKEENHSEKYRNKRSNGNSNSKNEFSWPLLVVWIISVLSLLIAILSFIKALELQKRVLIMRDRLEDSDIKLRRLLNQPNYKPQDQNGPTSSQLDETLKENITNIYYKLKELETSIAKIEGRPPVPSPPPFNKGKSTEKKGSRGEPSEGYFSIPLKGEGGKGYFEKNSTSRVDAYFSVKFKNNKANFRPIVDINTIKSVDQLDLAIKFEGRVTRNEANSMSLKQEGVARLIDDEWKIETKAIVELKR